MSSNWRPWITVAVLALAALVSYGVPSLARFRLVGPGPLVRTFVDPFRGRPKAPLWTKTRPREEETKAVVQETARAPESQDGSPPPSVEPSLRAQPPKEDISAQGALLTDPNRALKGFHEALQWVERGVGLVRILHIGDSVVTGDLITAEARARLQRAYGDGGPGWIYLARPWEWYTHLGLTLKGSGWVIQSPLLTARGDRRYGLAGLAFSSTPKAETVLSTTGNHPFSRLKVHYLAQPKGGSVLVRVDEEPPVELSTAGDLGPAFRELQLEADAAHTISLRPKGDGDVTLYGLVLERYGPGVVYDAIGSNGGAIQHLAHIDPGDWIEALRFRNPDLVILAFGTNETGYYNIPGPTYAANYREVVRRIRQGLPRASILIMAPMDRGERSETGEIASLPKVIRIVEAQREIAQETGCAFFDTFRAMGGEGAAGRWYFSTPRLMTADFTHPTRTGADALAKLLVEALQQRYMLFREEGPSGNPQEHRAMSEAGPESGQHRH